MSKNYSKAFQEVLMIIEQAQIEEKQKIPSNVIEYLRNNAQKEYQVVFPKEKELSELALSKEAKTLLSILYRNYIRKPEKGNNKKEVRMNLEERKKVEQGINQEEQLWYPVVVKKEFFLKRVFKKIKRLFKREIFEIS